MVFPINYVIMRKFNFTIDVPVVPLECMEVLPQSDVISPLLVDYLPSVDGPGCEVYHDITWLSENLSRFSDLSNMQEAAIVNALRSNPSCMTDGFTDDELFNSLKSRFCQLPAEVNAYINYINNNIDIINEDIKAAAAAAAESSGSSPAADSSSDVVS